MPIFKSVNKNFFKKWNQEMAYVLGFFAADGYITVNKRGGQFWSIQITDKRLLEDIKKVVESEHKITTRSARGNEKELYRLQIGSMEMCTDLRKLGYAERKSKSLAIPHIPKKYFSDFVRGYFDGDGNIWMGHTHKNVKKDVFSVMTAFTSSSHQFLSMMQRELTTFGMLGGSIYRSKNNYSRLQYSINNSLKLYDFMYNGLGTSKLFLQRKKGVFEKYKSMRL